MNPLRLCRSDRLPLWYLGAEGLVLFAGFPAALYLWRHHFADKVILSILLMCGLCLLLLLGDSSFNRKHLWNTDGLRIGLKPMLIRFLLLGAPILLFTAMFARNHLFRFPAERPFVWAMVMVLYPLLSALPQEVIFRPFFFHRYRLLLPVESLQIALSGCTFAAAHIFFSNWIAPAGALAAGLVFAASYARYRSNLLCTLEHALWGNFLFTVGLGWFFYGGSIQ